MGNDLIKLFSKNRAEEFPADVWGEYVLPPTYDSINLFNYIKPVLIEGGRGSGKTMFLRYHCHDTRYSCNRKSIGQSELNHIGIYFRPDTHFCSSITSNVYGDNWEKIFSKYLLINILKEISRFAKNISNCSFSFDFKNQNKFQFIQLPENLKIRIKTNVNDLFGLDKYSDEALYELNDWINDPDNFNRPVFPDTRSVLSLLLKYLKKEVVYLNGSKFNLYIDEYENFTNEQQILVNSWIKHGNEDLTISVAYKKFGSVTTQTLSNENLLNRNDYRKIDLEKFSNKEFQQFASEILILKLDGYIEDQILSNYKKMLCDEELLDIRSNVDYAKLTLQFAKIFFPTLSYKQVAKGVLTDKVLKARLINNLIKPALKGGNINAEMFVNDAFATESIINGVLLNRQKTNQETLLKEFKSLTNGNGNFYNSYKDTLVGAILWIFNSAGRRVVPIYSGFERICNISSFNLRHYIEFCYQCLVLREKSEHEEDFFISVEFQSLAMRKNSELEVEKVVELGRYGNTLRYIVNRLGLFFQILQNNKAQSEPEVVHFGIRIASIDSLPDNIKLLLNELKTWSILIEFNGNTKRKSNMELASNEYMLHPIFSANYLISFRKIRKHMFSIGDINTIFCGSEDEFVKLCSPYIKRNNANKKISSIIDIQGTLFDEIN